MTYTADDVELVARALHNRPGDVPFDYYDDAKRALDALAAVGRLLPADAEVETLWAWDCGENKVGPHLHHGEERWARTVASRTWPTGRLMRKWHAEGPWEPA